MNKISKLLITAAFAVGMVAMGVAQGAGPKGGTQGQKGGAQNGKAGQGQRGPGGGMRRGMNMFNNPEFEKRLKLTADQKKKLEAAGKEMQASMEKLMAGKDRSKMTREDFTALRPKMKPIQDKFQATVDKTLTAAQKKEMEKIRSEMMERFRQGGGPAGAGKGGATKGGGTSKGGTAKTGKGGGGL